VRFSKRIFVVLLAAVLVFSSVAPALASNQEVADKVQVTFENKTGALVRIQLRSTTTIYLNLNPGKTKGQLEPGIYKYSYLACGATVTGTLKVKPNGATLVLPKCKGGAGKAGGVPQVTFDNKTGASVRITLTGPKAVYLTLSTGKNKAELPAGTYKYSYESCGGKVTGNFKVKKTGDTLVLPKCKSNQNNGKQAKVTINNKTGGTLTIILNGPQYYVFYIPSGRSPIFVDAGKYDFTVYGCGGSSASGTKTFKGSGTVWSWWCY